jgi:TPR repeat protein
MEMTRLFLMPILWLCAAFAPAAAPPPDLRPRLEALSSQGNGEAAYHLGMLYHLGLNGVPKDVRKAFELFRLAAERGDPLGAYKLGCYYHGQGEGVVQADEALALRYKLIAAEAGYSLAQQDVAQIYAERGDSQRALSWLEAAALQDDARSLMMLGLAYSGELPAVPAPKDPAKAYAYMMLFARDGGGRLAGFRSAMESDLRAKTSAEDVRRGEAIIAAWRAKPTPLTEKALAGQDAARRLAAGAP